MKGIGPPPMHSRKGIKVLQSPQAVRVHHSREKQTFDSELLSVRSSRSRGISMSRESGINLDRIYDAKHFLPPKPVQKKGNGKAQEPRTLMSYKSLQFINLPGSTTEEKQQNNEQLQMKTEQKLRGKSPKTQNEADKDSLLVQHTPNRVAGRDYKAQSVSTHFHPNIISF